MKLTTAIVVLFTMICALAFADDAEVVFKFTTQHRQYQVAFLEAPKPWDHHPLTVWPRNLVLRCRESSNKQWREVTKIKGVRLEKMVKINSNGVHDALIISRPGGSAQFISLVEIVKNPAGLRILLRNERDKGGYDCLYDRQGTLSGFRFHYLAWHMEPEEGSVRGHVFTVLDLTWSPTKGAFLRGKVRIDHEAERKADLPTLLMAIAADEYLDVKEIERKGSIVTVTYPPLGILKDKTPQNLRSCKCVNAVIRRPDDSRKPYELISLEPCDG